MLMAVSCAWIIWEAIERIVHQTLALHHSIWPVAVVITSIVVDFWRSRKLSAVANRTGSAALATDAFHFASDIWSSFAVLCGLGASWLGAHYGIAALRYADPVAAMVVSLLILRLTVHLGHEAVSVLLDEIPAETRLQLIEEVAASPACWPWSRPASAAPAPLTLLTSHSRCPRSFTFEHTGELVRAATEAVHRALPEADVVIHTLPRQSRAESIFDRVRAVAARNNVSVHELSVQSHHGRLRVEQHVELDETMPLLKAHGFVTAMEAEILREDPGDRFRSHPH